MKSYHNSSWTCPHCGGKSFTITYLANGGGSIKCNSCGATGGGSLTSK